MWKIRIGAGLILACLLAAQPARAQTISYANAVGDLAAACGVDIDKYCKNVNFGGGRIQQCLNQNQARVSAGCKSTMTQVLAMLQNRANARASVLKVCNADIRRLCQGVAPGDGNLIDCAVIARRSLSAACAQAITDAGYW